MTIRENNWCEDCQETCTGHARVCTMCGGDLVAPPSTATASSSVSFRAMPDLTDFLPPELTTNELLRSVRQQVQATTALAANATANARLGANNNNANPGGEWQTIPEALLDPQIAAADLGRTPTDPKVLAALPREKLHERSASLFQVTLQTGADRESSDATDRQRVGRIYTDGCVTTGALGRLPLSSGRKAASNTGSTSKSTSADPTIIDIRGCLWTPTNRDQRTGKDPWTRNDGRVTNESSFHKNGYIALLERGHGVSFYTKSIVAQQQGALAVIIINDRSEPWPYYMQDSRSPKEKESTEQLTIPVVMISQDKGQALLQEVLLQQRQPSDARQEASSYSLSSSSSATVIVTIRHNDHQVGTGSVAPTCVVCREALVLGQTSLTLTNYCGHTFHESCALQWLEHHNTCPYCRRTLPTTSSSSEAERRRVMATSPGGAAANEAFYS